MGFEPTRAEPIGLAVQRLNHSATSSQCTREFQVRLGGRGALQSMLPWIKRKEKIWEEQNFPRRELNPGLLGESQIS